MTDGPYAETKEQMGGFWIIEAADLDTALQWVWTIYTLYIGAQISRPNNASNKGYS